jgi:hypothetical protein
MCRAFLVWIWIVLCDTSVDMSIVILVAAQIHDYDDLFYVKVL